MGATYSLESGKLVVVKGIYDDAIEVKDKGCYKHYLLNPEDFLNAVNRAKSYSLKEFTIKPEPTAKRIVDNSLILE